MAVVSRHNIARMISTTTGTGTLTLGTAYPGCNTFANAGITDGAVITYVIRDGANTEVGRGTYTSSGTTLSRDTVYSSTNSGSKISCTGRQNVSITIAAEELNQIDPYGIHHRLTTPHSDDDEFSSDTTGSYTSIDPAGSVTWAVANHCLTALFSGQLANDAGAKVKALTIADNEWLETCIRGITTKTNYTFAGLILTDGTTTTSNAVCMSLYKSATAGETVARLDYGTVTNLATPAVSVTLDGGQTNGAWRLRLKRTSSTAYTWQAADETGALWSAFGASTANPGFTPTHGGVFVSCWGGAHTGVVTFDYFRHMS